MTWYAILRKLVRLIIMYLKEAYGRVYAGKYLLINFLRE
jgi:hypothetical protein